MKWTGVLGVLVLAVCVSCGSGEKEPGKAPGDAPDSNQEDAGLDGKEEGLKDGVEQVGSVAVLQVTPAEEYASLKPDSKKTLKAEWKKALAADLKLYEIRGKENLRIKKMLEGIMQHGDGVPPSIYRRVGRYTRQVWLNRGVTRLGTGERIETGFIPGELAAAANIAITNGASMDMPKAAGQSLEANRLEELEGLLAIVRPEMFGPMRGLVDGGVGPMRTRRDGEPGSVKKKGSASPTAPEGKAPGVTVAVDDKKLSSALKMLWDDSSSLIKKVRKVGGLKSTTPEGPGRRFAAKKAIYAGGMDAIPVSSVQDLLRRGPIVERSGQPTYLTNLGELHFEEIGHRVLRAVSPEARGVSGDFFVRFQLSLATLSEIAGGGKDGTGNKPEGWMEDRLGEHVELVNLVRGELAALYLLDDQILQSAGMRRNELETGAMYRLYVSLSAAAMSSQEEETILRARALILGRLVASGAIKITGSKGEEDGGIGFQMGTPEVFKKTIAGELAEVRRIRFSGDRAGAARFIAEGEKAISRDVKTELSRRFKSLEVPAQVAFLYPLFAGADGLELTAFKSLKEHHLYLSGLGAPRDPFAPVVGR